MEFDQGALDVYEVWESGEMGLLYRVREGVERPPEADGDAVLKYRFLAATWEEACTLYNMRSGVGPYDPGPASRCDRCSEFVYREGTGRCWNCGLMNW